MWVKCCGLLGWIFVLLMGLMWYNLLCNLDYFKFLVCVVIFVCIFLLDLGSGEILFIKVLKYIIVFFVKIGILFLLCIFLINLMVLW